jgi:hypothetical protein
VENKPPFIDLFDWSLTHYDQLCRKLETAYNLEDHRRANKLFAITYKMHEIYTNPPCMDPQPQFEESGVA